MLIRYLFMNQLQIQIECEVGGKSTRERMPGLQPRVYANVRYAAFHQRSMLGELIKKYLSGREGWLAPARKSAVC